MPTISFSDLHPEVQKAAKRALADALQDVYRCGDTGVFMGYWVEVHTLGCRREAGDENLWESHFRVYYRHVAERSILLGNPKDGAFVAITPVRELGATMGASMLIELGRRVKSTIPLAKAQKLADEVYRQIKDHVQVALIAGSIRRQRPQIGDVELVVLPKDGDLEGLLLHLQRLGFNGGDRIQKKVVDGVPIEIYIAHKVDELGALLLMYTGDYVSNIALRSIAKRRGWKLDQYGIRDAKTGEWLLQSPDERDFYDFLGVRWHDPEERSFKDRPKGSRKKKKATMGAEMLIELGADKRDVGYISLELLTPDEERIDGWTLRVHRMDPFGGEPFEHDFVFEEQAEARTWFETIHGDEDIDRLLQIEGHE